MPAAAPVHAWQWGLFVGLILVCLAVDLTAVKRAGGVVSTRKAAIWTLVWFAFAAALAAVFWVWRGPATAAEFVTGYFVEFSLSLDNVAAIAAIFAAFALAPALQARVLIWGILGALMARGALIGLGAVLMRHFTWAIPLMGLFLVLTGLRWALAPSSATPAGGTAALRIARKLLPIAPAFDADRFVTRIGGKLLLTPLALVLVAVESSDLIFACDSVPAVFGVTQDPFVVFTSNMAAVLGLRSLYFLVAGVMAKVRGAKTVLAVILIAVGAKMLAARWVTVGPGWSLAMVAALLAIGFLYCLTQRGAKEPS